MSGPARGRLQGIPGAVGRPRVQAHAATVALPQPRALPLGPRIIEALVRLPDNRWLDRLLRGRAWIALIAMGLIGLVFMQVSMLGMNAGIGQAVEKSDVLSRQNADLRRDVSALSSEERIQREALAAGLVMPPAGDVRYLRSNGAAKDAAKAAKTMRAPSDAAKATVAAAQAGTPAVGSLVAGDTATQPGATGAPGTATGVTDSATGAATGSTSGATGSTSGAAAQTQVQPQAQTQTQSPPATQQQPQTQVQQAPQGTAGATAGATGTSAGTAAAATTGSTSGATGSTSGATAAGAAAAPGN